MRDRFYDDLTKLSILRDNQLERYREEGRQAVRLAHAREIAEIVGLLQHQQSVLVLCDKALDSFVLEVVKETVRLDWRYATVRDENGPLVGRLVQSLAGVLRETSGIPSSAVVIRHLDLMTSTVTEHSRPELADILFWLTELPETLKLAFWDPAFQLPKILEDLFPHRVSFQLFDREELWKLVSAEEARKFCSNHQLFTVAAQLILYQYLSGTHVVEVRRILRSLKDRALPDHDPEQALAHIRRQTGFQVEPAEAEPAGYGALRKWLQRAVILPVKKRHEASDDVALRQADALIPRGVILHGPPGTGKTEWARWLAQQLGATLVVIHGPELKNKYVGETEAAIRRLFAQARRAAPSLILIDEVDAMTPSRDDAGGHHFEASMVAQLLTEMDGLRREEAVIVVGTTNRLEALDRAFLRPGRFGSNLIEVPYPEDEDRDAILRQYSKRFALGLGEEDFAFLVEETQGPLDLQKHVDQEVFRKAWVERFADPELRRRAGPEYERRLAAQLGITPLARFSGDHLRAVCLHLLHALVEGRPPAGDQALLKDAVERVRRGAAVASRSAIDPSSEPPPMAGWGDGSRWKPRRPIRRKP